MLRQRHNSTANTHIAISVCERFDELSEVSWGKLLAISPDTSVFQQYGWVRAWWSTAKPDEAKLCVLLAQADGELVGIAPLYLDHGNRSARPVLKFLGQAHNDYQVYLVHPDYPDVYAAFHEFILSMKSLDYFRLNELPRSSVLHSWLREHSGRVVRMDPTPCPMLRLDIEQDITRFAGRKSVKRKLRKLMQLGSLKVEHLRDPNMIIPLLPILFDQHILRWEKTVHPSLFLEQRNRRFYEAMVRELSPGIPLFTRVLLDGRTIACHLGFESGRDLLWYKPSYELKYSQYSPGEYLMIELIRYAHEHGYRALDMTRGDEVYKSRFSNCLNWNDNFVIYPGAWLYATRKTDRQLRLLYRRLRAVCQHRLGTTESS